MSVEIKGTGVECEGMSIITSSRPWDMEIDALKEAELVDPDFPVLDVGGGGSSVTARLLSQGYDAYALDPLYTSRKVALEVIGHSFAGIAMSAMISGSEDELNEQKASFATFEKSIKRKPKRYVGESILDTNIEEDRFGTVLSFAMVETYLAEAGTAVFEKALRQMARITHPGGKVIMTTGIQYLPPETLPREEFDDLEAFFGREGAIYLAQDTDTYRFEKYLERLATQRSALETLMQEGLVEPDRIIRHYYQPEDEYASTTSLVLEVL